MKLDHVTYEVPVGQLTDASLDEFFKLLEMQEVKPDEKIEKGWNVRWFQDRDGFQIHLVEGGLDRQVCEPPIDLKLGHFCAVLSREGYVIATNSIYVQRNSLQSPRAWLRHAGTGLRVEIRPGPLSVDAGSAIKAGRERLCTGHAFLASHRGEIVMDPTTDQQLELIFSRCLRIFKERNAQHKDSWKREGWRGCLFNLRRKVERAWDHLWDQDPRDFDSEYMDQHVDDLLDSINYAALSVIAVEDGNKGGWWD